jgi:hypothetical protein
MSSYESEGDDELNDPMEKTVQLSDAPLSPEDAMKFRAILEETVERLQLIGHVASGTGKKLAKKREGEDAGSVGSRKDIFSLMLQQKELEQKFEQVCCVSVCVCVCVCVHCVFVDWCRPSYFVYCTH